MNRHWLVHLGMVLGAAALISLPWLLVLVGITLPWVLLLARLMKPPF